MDEMKRVAEYLIRNETMDGETFVKVYNGEIVPDKIVGEDLMTELQQELHAKVSKPAESARSLPRSKKLKRISTRDKPGSVNIHKTPQKILWGFPCLKCQTFLTFCCPPVIFKM